MLSSFKLALPLLLLSPFAATAAAGPSHLDTQDIRRSHSRRQALSPAQKREAELAAGRNATAPVQALDKRQSFHGRGTYYYVDVGPGACGNWGNNADYTVALNSAQYCCGYPGPHCFQTISITANGVTVGGVRIMDECPTCGWGDLDLSPGLFERFAGFGAGVIQLDWHFENGAPPAPTTTQAPPPPPTTSQWVEPSPAWTPPPAPSSQTPAWSPSPAPPPPPPSSSAAPPPPPPSSSSSSTSTAPSLAPSSSSSFAPSSSAYNASANPFAVVSSVNSTGSVSGSVSASATGSASGSASASGAAASAGTDETTHSVQVIGNNLGAISGLVTNYGQIVVVGAGGRV